MANSFRGRLVVTPKMNLGWSPWKRGLLRTVPYVGALLTAIELWDMLRPGKPAVGPLPNIIMPPGWTPGCVRNPLRGSTPQWNTPDVWWSSIPPAGYGCGTGGVPGGQGVLPATGADFQFSVPPGARGLYIGETWQPGGAPNRVWRSYARPAVGVPDGPIVYQPPRPKQPPVFVKPQPVVNPWVPLKPGFPQPAPVPIPYTVLPKAPALPDPYVDPWPDEPTPTYVPGVIVIPGQPHPVYVPVPLPAPQPGPKPGGPVAPGPGVRPANPWPDLGPGTPPYVVPAPTTGVVVTPANPVPVPIPPKVGTHSNTRPQPRQKEKKVRVPAAFRAIMSAVGFITEAGDMIDVVYGAIPCSAKFKAGMFGRHVNAWDKAQFIQQHAGEIDTRELMRGYMKNQFEDAYYGRLSPESAYYQQARDAGLGPLQGGKFHRYSQRSEAENQELRRRGFETKDPIVDAFNQYVDSVLGSVPDGFKCCAGKHITCGQRKGKRS